ncbi:MAG: hypothetical protein N2C14_18995 [Planctomycetales bacterium]
MNQSLLAAKSLAFFPSDGQTKSCRKSGEARKNRVALFTDAQ